MAKRRRVTLDVDGVEVLFRVPTAADVWAVLGTLPVLPTSAGHDGEIDPTDPRAMQAALASLAQADATLRRCALAPRLVDESVADQPEGEQSLQELDPEARFAAMTELYRIAGFSEEAVEEVRPLSETGQGSSGSG
ncbi:MAG: hypothetical protein Q9Q40_14160 [Acidobacteriota bacterium]|nr:hypothetical protein [Acidobacteriota bacterium]